MSLLRSYFVFLVTFIAFLSLTIRIMYLILYQYCTYFLSNHTISWKRGRNVLKRKPKPKPKTKHTEREIDGIQWYLLYFSKGICLKCFNNKFSANRYSPPWNNSAKDSTSGITCIPLFGAWPDLIYHLQSLDYTRTVAMYIVMVVLL